MRVDRKWVERNLGFDPIATPPPDANTHNFAKLSRKMRRGCPALQAKRLGAYKLRNRLRNGAARRLCRKGSGGGLAGVQSRRCKRTASWRSNLR